MGSSRKVIPLQRSINCTMRCLEESFDTEPCDTGDKCTWPSIEEVNVDNSDPVLGILSTMNTPPEHLTFLAELSMLIL